MTGLPFKDYASTQMDKVAIEACISCGLVVLVEICPKDCNSITGILSAHASVSEAFMAYVDHADDAGYAIIVPQEAGSAIFYQYLTLDELLAAGRR